MKKCVYCGRDNEDSVLNCRECGTVFNPSQTDSSPEKAPEPEFVEKLEFATPTAQEMQMDFVTLLRCRTLVDADMLASQLESAGIPTFIPDQFLMQNIAWNLNTFGYVRLQVSPKDFSAAKELLSASKQIA